MSDPSSPNARLTTSQEALILSACPRGSRVISAVHFQPEYVPGPLRICVCTPDGMQRQLVLRIARHGSVERESRVLRLLHRIGLPVPQVLAGPSCDPDLPLGSHIALYSLLPGINLQRLSERSAEDCRLAGRLVLQGARELAAATDKLRRTPEGASLPTLTLRDQLTSLVHAGGPWLRHVVFVRATEILDRLVDDVVEPVFTGGDYQPANFLTDGISLTGFVDFELAGYQDFLYGFVKYAIYDVHPLNKSGFIDYLLTETGLQRREFDIRLALGCLMTLHREIPVEGGDRNYRDHVLNLLNQACAGL